MKAELEFTKSESTGTIEGKIMTGIFIASAIYIAIKHRKEPVFWTGVGAMFLMGVSIKTSKK